MQKKRKDTEAPKNTAMKDESEESRNSSHGYLEQGNPAEVHAKARAVNK